MLFFHRFFFISIKYLEKYFLLQTLKTIFIGIQWGKLFAFLGWITQMMEESIFVSKNRFHLMKTLDRYLDKWCLSKQQMYFINNISKRKTQTLTLSYSRNGYGRLPANGFQITIFGFFFVGSLVKTVAADDADAARRCIIVSTLLTFQWVNE